jgi:hypothetical protein
METLELKLRLAEISDLNSAGYVLIWDQIIGGNEKLPFGVLLKNLPIHLCVMVTEPLNKLLRARLRLKVHIRTLNTETIRTSFNGLRTSRVPPRLYHELATPLPSTLDSRGISGNPSSATPTTFPWR